MNKNISRMVLVCQGRTCRKYGSAMVLKAFQIEPIPGVEVAARYCLGECGNGPMVVILPEEIWYDRVHPDDVGVIIEQHLRGGCPVEAMLYRKFHRSRESGQ